MPRDTNPQGIGLRPEERTVQQILYQRQHQAEIREQIEAQRNGHSTPTPQVNVAHYIDQQRGRNQGQSPDTASSGRRRRHRSRADAHAPIGELGQSNHSRKRHNGRGRFRGQ